ncbi:scarecrow-like protein 28 [Bidens hawaiensis]|uniref:scarecrow-like protein 28 n=1 Tax=Bidens hawaiensis TaxID=980011 RepID=UPI00404B2D6C
MLAGFSSSLLSPRHTKPSAQFQACHFPSMSTQRLDLPCNSNTNLSRAQPVKPIRPVSSLSIDTNPIEARTCSLRHNVARPGSKRPKKLYEDEQDGSFRAKRKRGCGKVNEFGDQFWHPSDVISPNLTTSPWSFVNELADLGEPDQQRATNESSSGSGSGSQESHQSLNLDQQEGDPNVGPPNPNQSLDLSAIGTETHDEDVGFELISLLLACLEAISMKNIATINHFISKLGELANPRGNSSITRLASYYTEALALRVSRMWPNIFQISTPRELIEEDNGTALQILNQATPIPKFIHFTSNEILLRSFEGKDRVHIIDFDIKNGLQWPSFFQSLASRTNPPTRVRITGIGESKQDLLETGARLAGIAESLNLEFEFHPVVDRLEDVRLWMLHVKEGETVGVNCVFQLHKLLYDHTGGAVKDFLGLIQSVNPSVVVVAEQESEHNGVGLEPRVANSLKYYSAIFDCIEESFGSKNGDRVKIEEAFGREIRNIIACEGLERFERHVGFDRWWRSLTELGGFRNAGINEREFVQSEMITRMYHRSYGPGSFKVERRRFDGGATAGITLTWSGQPLYTVSAWVPDVAGSSGSYRQQQEA